MMQARQTLTSNPGRAEEAGEKESIVLCRLRSLFGGTGAISTVIIYAHAVSGYAYSLIILIVLLVALVTWVALHAANLSARCWQNRDQYRNAPDGHAAASMRKSCRAELLKLLPAWRNKPAIREWQR